MGKKRNYHREQLPALAESYERIPSPDERVTPFRTEHDYTVDEALADRCIEILMSALAEPHAPKGCVECIMVCFALISLGPNKISNAQIVRYNRHDFLDICMRFLTSPRTPEQYDAADKSIQNCTCLNDDSPFIDALLATYCDDVPAQRLQATNLGSAALKRPKGKRERNPSGHGGSIMSDECELEYEEARSRGEIGNFLDSLHVYRSDFFEWSNSLGDVLCQVSNYLSSTLQPFHDRVDLHKFKDTGKRCMWPARVEQLLPFGPRDTIAGLGYTAFRTLCWTSAGIAGLIVDIVKGPTTMAVVDSSYFAGAFVLMGAAGLDELRELVEGASQLDDDSITQSYMLLIMSSHLCALAGTMLALSVPNLRLLNARSLEQTTGLVDIYHMCNAWVAALDLFSFPGILPPTPERFGDIKTRVSDSFAGLCAALHHALGFASGGPPDPSLQPHWMRCGDRQRASTLRTGAAIAALTTSIHELDILYDVQRLAYLWVSATDSLVKAVWILFYSLSERRCWAPGCTMSAALNQDRFKRCAACWHVTYCSRECQKTAWRDEHKEVCAVLRRVSEILQVPRRELVSTESAGAAYTLLKANAAQNWTSALIADLEMLTSHFKPILDCRA